MMQTTRIRRLDRLARKRDPGKPVHLVFEFNWGEDEEAARPQSRDTKESGTEAASDPVLNSGWAAPQGDGKPSL